MSLAPSFIANYEGVGIEAMREAVKQLGFYDAEETAIGATMVKREYDRMLKEEDHDIVISSCCHSINLLIRKYFPEQLPYLADVVSPMVAHCMDIKRRIPGAKTVFVGPCVAKKDEAAEHSDAVDIAQGKIHKCFIEMSTCAGSCIGGPVMEKYRRSPVADYMAVSNFAGSRDFDIDQPEVSLMRQPFAPLDSSERMPSDFEIMEILREMGKFKPSDELNCGSCGYDTCRAKAVAIYQGKAEISMCLPFLKEKAESFSDAIVKNSPNALIVVNDAFEVQQLNDAALRLLNIRFPSDVLGDQVVRILHPDVFMEVRRTKRGVYNKRAYLAEYQRYVEEMAIPVDDGRMILCIMHDVTAEEEQRQRKEDISRETVEVADRVVEKQMRIAQEIASLLGETTAETKIALSKLKESISTE